MSAIQTAPPRTTRRAADPEHLLRLYRQMLRIRRFEEKCVELYAATKIRGFLHVYVGEEAVAVGSMQTLRPGDAIVATYREHGQALARGISARSIMAEMFGKQEGCSRGRGGSMHLFDTETNFYGGNAIVGGGLPLAVGVGLAQKMQGTDAITACYFGDGATAEGAFHESMNLAALWQLPVLFLCENNLYAMGTAIERAQAQTNLTARALSYRMAAEVVDGMDVLACEDATARAAAHVRSGAGPYFLEFRTYRFRAHSMYDPELYRSKDEVAAWRERDPIPVVEAMLREDGAVDDEALARIEADVMAEVEDAIEFAEAGTLEPVEDLERFVYSEVAR
ncbi:MAG: pyruvate dehydrogenase (acetyl-transferring) E1 component subunit alpha [Chloroflexota bacterium]